MLPFICQTVLLRGDGAIRAKKPAIGRDDFALDFPPQSSQSTLMKYLYYPGIFAAFLGGWFLARNSTHGTPLWWGIVLILVGGICFNLSVFKRS